MQYSNTKLPITELPAMLIIGLDGYRKTLLRLEEEINQEIDSVQIISQLLDALSKEEQALIELDYYCLGFLEEHCRGNLYREFECMLEYIHNLGMQLYQNFKMHKAYVRGELPYKCCDIKSNGLYLKRKDLFHAEINRELSDANLNAYLTADTRVYHLKY